jgi:hypothetical protein
MLHMVHAHLLGALAAKNGKSREGAIRMVEKAKEVIAEHRKPGWAQSYASLRPYHVEMEHKVRMYVECSK